MRKANFWQTVTVGNLALLLLVATMFQPVSAGMINTSDALAADLREQQITQISQLIQTEEVAQQLLSYGVDAADVQLRLASLSDAELQQLHDQLESAEAGGDAVAVIGVVFLVLLILELVGVTDIFKSF